MKEIFILNVKKLSFYGTENSDTSYFDSLENANAEMHNRADKIQRVHTEALRYERFVENQYFIKTDDEGNEYYGSITKEFVHTNEENK